MVMVVVEPSYVENKIIEWSGDEGLKWKTGTHRTGMDCGGRGSRQ